MMAVLPEAPACLPWCNGEHRQDRDGNVKGWVIVHRDAAGNPIEAATWCEVRPVVPTGPNVVETVDVRIRRYANWCPGYGGLSIERVQIDLEEPELDGMPPVRVREIIAALGEALEIVKEG